VTPGARMFDAAGLRPLPTGVRDARRTLARLSAGRRGGADAPAISATRPGAPALPAKNLSGARGHGGGAEDAPRWPALAHRAGEGGGGGAVRGATGAGRPALLRRRAGLPQPLRGRAESPAGVALLPQSPGDLFVRERVEEELPGEEGRAALDAVELGWASER